MPSGLDQRGAGPANLPRMRSGRRGGCSRRCSRSRSSRSSPACSRRRSPERARAVLRPRLQRHDPHEGVARDASLPRSRSSSSSRPPGSSASCRGTKPAWVNPAHRWSGRLAFVATLPVAYHCIFKLGFQSGDLRVLWHSLLGSAFYGAFAAKVTIVELKRFPGLDAADRGRAPLRGRWSASGTRARSGSSASSASRLNRP